MKDMRKVMRRRLSQSGEKVRNVIALIYLEDLMKYGHTYGDLLGYMSNLNIMSAVSPIHDRDFFTSWDVYNWCTRHIDPDTGDLDENYLDDAPYVGKPKKPHVHIQLRVSSQHDAAWFSEQMLDLLYVRDSVWEKCLNPPGNLRYMAHMDDPDKAQYAIGDIHGFGGIDMSPLLKRDEGKNITLQQQVHEMITNYNLRYFYQLVDQAHETGDLELLSYVRGSAGYYNAYMRSKQDEIRDKRAAVKAAKEGLD